jgi:hypothetical protein
MGELNPISLKNFAHYNTFKNKQQHKPLTTPPPPTHIKPKKKSIAPNNFIFIDLHKLVHKYSTLQQKT